jgi:glutamyl/glutaminyl-tRNA synthetase
MSKRQEGDLVTVDGFRAGGVNAEALLNYIALLGWSPGGGRERMTLDEMVQAFSLKGINKSNAQFDQKKLLAFNTQYNATAKIEDLVRGFKLYLGKRSPLAKATDADLATVIQLCKGAGTFIDVERKSLSLFQPDEQLAIMKPDDQDWLRLQIVKAHFERLTEWTEQNIERIVRGACEETGCKLGAYANPLRTAVLAQIVTPPLFGSLAFLGRDRTLARLNRALVRS